MKQNRPLPVLIIIAILSLLLITGCGKQSASSTALSTSSQTPASSTTTVAAPENLTVLSILGGDIQVSKKGTGDWRKGEEGMTLEIGDRIKTDAEGKALITFFEGSIIELENDTEISIIELGANADRTTAVKLKQEVGTTISRVTKLLDPADSYEIETNSAVATVRGSIMFVGVPKRLGPTFVGNIEGKVFVIAQGVEVQLPEGTHTNVSPGEPPTSPEPGATPQAVSTTTTSSSSTSPATSTSTTTTSTTTTTTITTSTTTSTSSATTSTSTSTATTTEPPLTIEITSLLPEEIIEQSQTITVSGVVSDLTITEATLIVNGVSSMIPVVNGTFNAVASLTLGVNNTIIVSVTRDGVTVSAIRTLELEEQVPR